MTVLVIGSGGREHALVQAIVGSDADVHVAPGNPGIAAIATCHAVVVDDIDGLVELARRLVADLVVIGPEVPLVLGLADALRGASIAVFGPSRAAAQVEGSKAFAKELMVAAGVPTADYRACATEAVAMAAVDEFAGVCVVKADGLAAGKGVLICTSASQARAAVGQCFGGEFGSAGTSVVVEELMSGPEVSLLTLCVNEQAIALAPAQDFKRVGDGDRGLNTGGMGAYSPLPWLELDPTQLARELCEPILRELARRGTPFSGCLYAGIMLTSNGPRVLEYNVRFGDPETQALCARTDSLLAALAAVADGRVPTLEVRDEAAVTVVLAAPGYPEAPRSGQPITGIERAEALPGVTVQHAGTAQRDGTLVVSGGRVVCVTAIGDTLAVARDRAYAAAELIEFEGKHNRTDIALEASRG